MEQHDYIVTDIQGDYAYLMQTDTDAAEPFQVAMALLQGGSVVQNQTGNAGDTGSIPWQEDPQEEGMATHSSIIAWEIQRTEEPSGLQSTGLQRIRHN